MDSENARHDNLDKVKKLLTALLVLMLFAVAYFAKDMLLPIVIGLLLALTVSPFVRGASRLGIPSAVTAGIIIFGLAFVFLGFVFFMGGTLTTWVQDLPSIGAEIKSKLHGITSSVEAVKDASEEVEKIAEGQGEDVQKVTIQRPPLIASAASNLGSFAISLGVGMVLAFFLLASGNIFYVKLVQSFPKMKDKKRALKIVYDIERRISHYLLAIASINAGLGVAIAVALHLIGMPYAYLWGLLAAALNFVPFIGALFGVAAVAAVSIVTFDSLAYAALAPLSYLVLTSIEAQFVTPWFLGRRLELNTVSVFLAVIFWAWLWGIPGALMAVPALVALKVVADNVDGLHTLSNFLSRQDVAATEADSVD